MTTGMVSCPLAAHSLSRVMPSVSGIQMSSRTRSGRARSRSRRASPALSATVTWCPSSDRISDSSSRIPTSSSTTKICAIPLRRFRQGQQYAHRRAAAGPIFDRHAAVVLIDDLLYDRQPEAGAARLGGDIRFEDARHQFLGKAGPVVRHRKLHAIASQLGAHLDRRTGAGLPAAPPPLLPLPAPPPT